MSPTVTPEFIKEFRSTHGLSQASLADYLQVSKRNVENWESGVREPPRYLRLAMLYVAEMRQAEERVALMKAGAYKIGRNGDDVTETVILETEAQIRDFKALLAAHKGQ